MKSLSNVATFERVAEAQSFVEAANWLGLSPFSSQQSRPKA